MLDKSLLATSPCGIVINEVLRDAKLKNASDIHIEPTEHDVQIRFRIFGEMTLPQKNIPKFLQDVFLSDLKKILGLSIAISGRPQDSRASFSEYGIDVRANLLPTIYGEKVVLRILDLGRNFKLSSVGFSNQTVEDLKLALEEPNGVILISGPTGSGKTTTLYSLLNELGPQRKNIVTLEDPVEYRLKGMNQVQISPKISFGQGLRAILRQDPDIILVGEIRDEETADLCFKAASTGHLVLSTIHANGAREVCERLEKLGVEKYLLKSNLRFSAAQKLLPKICENCSSTIGSAEKARVLKPTPGCNQCVGGITGRIPILEYLDKKAVADYFDDKRPHEFIHVRNFNEQYVRLVELGLVDAGGLCEYN